MAGKGKQEEQDLDDAQEEVIEDEKVKEADKDDRGDDADPDVNAETLKKVAAGAEEEESTEEEGEGEEEKKTPKTVPYGRLAKVTAEKAALEEELAELRKSKAAEKGAEEEEQEEAYDFKAKEREYLKLVSEGEIDAAADLRVEIDDRRADENQARATAAAVETIGRTEADREFGKAVTETLKKHPWLDNKSPDADKEAIDDVVAFRDYYITKKQMSPADALRKAAERVAKTREPDEAEAEEEDAEEKGKAKAKEAAAARTKEALKKAAAAAEKQPAAIAKGKGNRTSEDAQLDVAEMDEDTFDKLPAEEKKRLRGD